MFFSGTPSPEGGLSGYDLDPKLLTLAIAVNGFHVRHVSDLLGDRIWDLLVPAQPPKAKRTANPGGIRFLRVVGLPLLLVDDLLDRC